ncbi:MAG: hypothetical protein ACLGIB_08235 [Actinomycetota bacterium]
MSQTLKVTAALVFVAILGWVLLQPVFDAVEIVDETGTERTATPIDPTEPTSSEAAPPAPSEPEEESAALPEEFRTQPLSESYPKRCLRPGAATEDLVMVKTGDRVVAGPLRGPLEELGGRDILGISASDGWVAWADGDRAAFIARPGVHDTISPVRVVRAVVWSPVSRCGLAVTKDGRLSLQLGNATLVRDEVRTVAFSPDGRKLAIVTAEDEATSIWIAALDGERMREVLRERPGVAIDLEGWSPAGDAIFYRLDRGGLGFVTTSVPPLSGRVSPEPSDELDHPLEQCGGRLLGLIQNRIAEITIQGPEYLTGPQPPYRYISCAPAGNFIAAIGNEGLVLLDGSGNFLRDLTQDSGFTDVFVDWGAPGRGLIFGRVRSDGSPVAAELWYISEGGSPVPTGVTYRAGPDAVDWSGSPPTGLP